MSGGRGGGSYNEPDIALSAARAKVLFTVIAIGVVIVVGVLAIAVVLM